jgi:arginase
VYSQNVQVISAPSILGLTPSGVQLLPAGLLRHGLQEKLRSDDRIIQLSDLNDHYSTERDVVTQVLNGESIKRFSLSMHQPILDTLNQDKFPLVLGGDCSIIIGVMSALKQIGKYGLVFMDAHADFYEPEKSTTGQAADMDLAIVTGRGPDLLTNINGLKPYVTDEKVIHIGQRDWEETQQHHSQDIRKTDIHCWDHATITRHMPEAMHSITATISAWETDGCWIHFDTDVLSDDINPAVDYRLPGGLSFLQAQEILQVLLQTRKIAGMSVTIFNPSLDKDQSIARNITECIANAFSTAE